MSLTVLFLHGWKSIPGGVKPTRLAQEGWKVLNPSLPDEDFPEAVRIAQQIVDEESPDVIVGSSRGGAAAMNVDSHGVPLVLLCPAWKRWGSVQEVPPGTVVLHSEDDEVIPIAESRELLANSHLPSTSLWVVGTDHRLAGPEPLEAMVRAVKEAAERSK